ncbi:MAG: GIY-YIG nuclease family protein [Alphaproteobacteria bacterium]|nr:GIY-YIG nuclease family protein [Alphaproteobacteria bacterium]
MSDQNHKRGYWTKERCTEEAAKYITKSAFRNGSPGAFSSAYRHGWLDEICQNLKLLRTYYSIEECAEEAKKYTTKTEFIKKAPLHYSHAIRKGFLNKICNHMEKQGSPLKRAVYVFEFADNYAYIGLTSNLNRREKEHLTNHFSAVFRHIQESKCSYMFKCLTDYLSKEEAAEIEINTIIEYANNGWCILNKKSGGDLGSKIRKYTKQYCKEITSQYSDKRIFQNLNPYFYRYISKRGWLDELCSHMVNQKKKNGYWTKARCKEAAEKFNKRIDFQKGNPAAHSAAFKNGWLDEVCSHMSYNEFEPTKWTKQICAELAKQYKTRGKFKANNSSAYKIALRHKWLDEIFKDLPYHGYRNERVMIANEERKTNGSCKYWTEYRIFEEAKKYHSLTEFSKKASGAYDAACSLKILDKIRKVICDQ